MNVTKRKLKIMSCFTCFAIMVGLLCGWNFKVNATDNSRLYWKYTYDSDGYNISDYSYYYLNELPIVDNIPETREAVNIDNRENASLEQQIVCIKYDGNVNSTGFIIGDHEIMTAAHCVAMHDDMFAKKPQITIPTSNPSNGNEISLTPLYATFPDDYFSDESNTNRYDYAIVKVEEDLSSYGHVYLGLGTDETIKNVPIHSLGYTTENNKPVLKISNGNITTSEEQIYFSSCLVYGKTSGGPAYSECRFGIANSSDPDEKIQVYKTVIGVTMGEVYDSKGETIGSRIIRITPEILQFAYNNSYLS
ncbi:trypsin-like serine peptidase [Porcipelethomonas sp.]|uniref:trypsin-like serine peptidase n=1 Tax=Porcipelethomonas sp. TaxID=2981675 RepID=UPI003EF9A8CA